MTHAVSGLGMTSQRTRTRMIERLRSEGIRNERVLAAIAAVPRHLFVEEALASRAYEDSALPLGFAQTISQPYVVAHMIEILLEGRKLGKTLVGVTPLTVEARVNGPIYSALTTAPTLWKDE